MALLIQPKHHSSFNRVLRDCFRLRREVFIERPGWSLPHAKAVAERGLEVDEFDNRAAIYLARLGDDGRLEGTVRFTPSTEPNMSCDVLGPYMGIEMPRGPSIVEISRVCADPSLTKDERRAVMLDMRACVGALFLRYGWTHGIGVGHDHHIQPRIRAGLKVEMLGPPVIFPGDRDPSFAALTSDPEMRLAAVMAGRPGCLQDPDEDPSLIARYGERAVA